jgi:hypothetical protein
LYNRKTERSESLPQAEGAMTRAEALQRIVSGIHYPVTNKKINENNTIISEIPTVYAFKV